MRTDEFYDDEDRYIEDIPLELKYNDGLPPARNLRMVVFGGSFDPVHVGHINLALKVLELGLGDEVMFVPTKLQPLKGRGHFSSPEDRVEMLRLALENYEKFSYSDIELTRGGDYSYTIDTLEVLKKIFPDRKLSFLMGSDSLCTLHKWHRALELVNRYDFIIYPRPSDPMPTFVELSKAFGIRNASKLLQSVISQEEAPAWNVSSTELRRLCAEGADTDLIPPKVLEYIREKHIY